ncbi:hypothetical protein HK103_003301 [Boothiomyces macroporosus]|uniref:Methyltransferase domain-containing protein n=1 Tax=Boothiomyces macroporosus TaxID=261099 RepID=A0AAD5UIU7_9FUNG|nr:hypothetical protein HK103_003301 [Boothiomyces macroporosus]
MSKNLSQTIQTIDELKAFIQEFSWLSDFFAIDFLITDYWNTKFPDDWKFLQFERLETLCDIVAKGKVDPSWPDSLKEFIHKATNLGLNRFPSNDLKYCQLDKEVEIGMKQKKIAEVKSTAVYIDDICVKNGVTHILDFGAGQGYLSSVLAYQYGYNVIAVDSDILQTSGGEQRAKRILNLYSLHQKQVRGVLSQAAQRWEDYPAIKESLRRLFYRSVLQKLLVDNKIVITSQDQSDAIKSTNGEVAIKKLGAQACTNPVTYTKAALERLGCEQKLEDGLVLGTFEWYASVQSQIAAIWTLRTMLANVIESLILTDRCIYMSENNFNVDLIAMADPDVSPRNMAIIVTKK